MSPYNLRSSSISEVVPRRWVVTKTLSITAGEFWLMPNGLKAVAGLVSSNAARNASFVDDWAKAFVAAIFVIAEPGLPVPCPEIVSKLTQITLETAGELVVLSRNLVGTRPRFQCTVTHPPRELCTGRCGTYLSLRKARVPSARRNVVRHCERIERVLNRYANALGTYP